MNTVIKNTRLRRSPSLQSLLIAAGLISGCAVFLYCQLAIIRPFLFPADGNIDQLARLTPWECVGGCGAGGSGNSGGASVKWIGKGVSGGLIDVQSLGGYSLFRDHSVRSLTNRFSYKPTYTSQIGLTVPIYDKMAAIQPSTLYQRQYEETGGTGDLALDGTINFGMEGEFACMISLCLPTGQYNIVRGSDQTSYMLPSLSQMGTGLTVPALTLSYSKDVENGIWVFDATYSHPMATSFSGKNEFLGSYFKDYKDSTGNKRFYYYLKPYGENDLGDYTPPSISATAYYGMKGDHEIMQSFGLTFCAPLGVAWIHNEIMNGTTLQYNPRPDPDQLAWSAQLIYGAEFSNPKRPLYFAIVKPIHDVKDPRGKWNGPDMEALKNEWGLVLGVKATMF
jgi:hypothetical protein